MNSFNPNPNILKEQKELFPKDVETLSQDGFEVVYGDFKDDIARYKHMEETHSVHEGDEGVIGFKGERLILGRLQLEETLGKGIKVFKSAKPDDVLRGCDGVMVSTNFHRGAEPVVLSIDVTLNQMSAYEREKFGNKERDGLETKLKRVVNHINYLSRITAGDARNFNSWLSSGGMSKERPKDRKDPNYKFWEMSDRIIQVRYFRNPSDDPISPNTPHPVIAGPQAVLSLDSVFFNRATSVQHHHIRVVDINKQIDDILRAETYIAVQSLLTYMDKMIKNRPQMNSVFDAYYSSTKSWMQLLNEDDRLKIFELSQNEISRDKMMREQMRVYVSAIKKEFGI